MAIQLFKLVGSIFIDNEEANKSIAKTEKKTGSAAKSFGNGIKTAAKWGTAIVAGATAATAGVVAMAKKTAASADEVDKMSQKLGMSKKGYQEWNYVLSQNGVKITSMTTGLKTLTNKIDDAKNGSKNATEMFSKLGISMSDLQSMSREDAFNAVVKGIQGMKDSTERAALANDLFGKSGQNMTALFNQSAQSTENLKNKANELGMVMSDDTVDAGVKFTDTLDTLKKTGQGLFNSFGGSLMPMITKLCTGIINYMPQIKATLSSLQPSFEQIVVSLAPLLVQLAQSVVPTLLNLISAILPIIVNIASVVLPILLAVLTGVTTSIKWCINNIPIVATAIGLVTAAILALKGATIAHTIATKASAMATKVQTAYQAALNTVMNANPISIIIIAIAALVAAFVVLWNKCDWFRKFWINLWGEIKSIIKSVIDWFCKIPDKVKGLLNKIGSFFSGLWDGIKKGFKSMINGVIRLANKWVDGLNALLTPIRALIYGIAKAFGSKLSFDNVKIPHIPMLATGGNVLKGKAIVGEAGPELLNVSGGKTTVTPLTSNQKLSNTGMNFTFNIEKFINNTDKDADTLVDTIYNKFTARLSREGYGY